MRELTSEEQWQFRRRPIRGGSPENPYFLADSEYAACLQIDQLLDDGFQDFSSANTTLETLGVVAAYDARKRVRLKAVEAIIEAVSDHLPTIGLRNVVVHLDKVVEADSNRIDHHSEVFRAACAARVRVEAARKSLPISYRPATADDAPEMADLFTRRYYGQGRKVDSFQVELCRATAENPADTALIAELNGRLIGMAVTTNDDRGATLEMIAGELQYSRGGVGRELLNRSMRSARLLGSTTIRLGAVNLAERAFYRAAGFIPDPGREAWEAGEYSHESGANPHEMTCSLTGIKLPTLTTQPLRCT